MRTKDYSVVDVFSDRPVFGNPVAVVFDAHDLNDETMLAITRWLNLSETTFVTGLWYAQANSETVSGYDIRIFGQKGELPFAGHPTLGTAAAVRERCDAEVGTLVQHGQGGEVRVRFCNEAGVASFHAPSTVSPPLNASQLTAVQSALQIQQKIKAGAIIDSGPRWITVIIDGEATIEQLEPSLNATTDLSREHDALGIMVGAICADGKNMIARTFAPIAGVAEDPVCGSGNIALARLRRDNGSVPASYYVRQGQQIGRDGTLLLGYREGSIITLGGKTHCTAKGSLSLFEGNKI